jgi:YaiO family outer membrane protein
MIPCRPLLPFLLPTLLGAATFDEGLALKRSERFPEAIVVFTALVEAEPRNVDALEQLATLLGWQQRYSEAIATWERALALAPGRVSLRVGRARVWYWQGRLAAALEEVTTLLHDHPGDFDLLEFAGDLQRANGDPGAARALYGQALAIDPSVSELRRKLERTRAPRLWRLDAGGILDDYAPDAGGRGGARNHEQSAYLALGHRWTPALTTAGGIDWQHHFGLVDWRWGLDAALVVDNDWTFSARGAVSESPHFLARWEGGGAIEWRAATWLAPHATVRELAYPDERITSYAPGLRVQPNAWLALDGIWYLTTSSVNPDTRAALGRITLTLGDWAPYVLVSHGEENVPPLGVASTTTIGAGLVWQASSALGLRVDASHEDRTGFYQRTSVGGGIFILF